MLMTRRAVELAAIMAPLNPIGRRDYERLLDEAVSDQIKQRFGVLCSRMATHDSGAFDDFKDSILVVFEARRLAEEFLFEEMQKVNPR